jgi:hypothetical protein
MRRRDFVTLWAAAATFPFLRRADFAEPAHGRVPERGRKGTKFAHEQRFLAGDARTRCRLLCLARGWAQA